MPKQPSPAPAKQSTPSTRKFYRTVVKVVVLSESPLEEMDLDGLHFAITDGDCSGQVNYASPKVLTGPQAARALRAQGSDAGFFQLTDRGEDSDE